MADIFKQAILSEQVAYIKQPIIEPIKEEISDDMQIAFVDELERARLDAYQLGFAEGVAQERAQTSSCTDSLKALLHNIPEAICANRLQLACEIADIVLMIASQLFITQQHNKNTLIAQVTQIINQLNAKHVIEVRLHPDDLDLIQAIERQHDPKIQLRPDDNLRLGGCIVLSEHGTFNASIERQIDNLKQVLLDIKSSSCMRITS